MYHYSQGIHTKQAHKGIPEGCFEEEQGRKGFFGQVSHLIKSAPSTRWTEIEGDLRPHMYNPMELSKNFGTWVEMLYNADVGIYNLWEEPLTAEKIQAHRNADGDTMFFCHQGQGEFLTEYGLLKYEPGSYVNIPKCVTYSILAQKTSQFFIVESRTGSYREPDRGMVGRNAVYDTEAIVKPNLDLLISKLKSESLNIQNIFVKRAGKMTRFGYASSVYDTLGWKGDYFPFSLHIRDMMPLLSARVHLPPSAHATFVSHGFIICTFLPRPLESDKDALKVPFYHQNIDYDEVLFYHDGNFFSRENLKPGMMSLHPAGFPHGPHPKAIKNVENLTYTEEVAVMVDTWNELKVSPALINVELPDYWKSWMTK